MRRLSRAQITVLLATLVLAGVLLLTPRAEAQQLFNIPSVTVSGGGLAQSIDLAPADADAFRRRINQLPRLEDPPDAQGPAYRVTSSYWPVAVRLEDEEEVLDVSVQGEYYPQGGYVRLEVDDEPVWAVINLRQRAILDRYIRLAEAGRIGETPSTLAVLSAAAEDEVYGIAAGDNVLAFEDGAALLALLALLAESNPDPQVDPRQPPLESDGYWLVVTLLEGRTLRYFYDGTTVTEALGTERYDASSAKDQLDALAPGQLPSIEEHTPAGSLLWWPVMAGGGLLALGIAVWLRRRSLAI